eukprot:3490218-Amphidinium_carterae.1
MDKRVEIRKLSQTHQADQPMIRWLKDKLMTVVSEIGTLAAEVRDAWDMSWEGQRTSRRQSSGTRKVPTNFIAFFKIGLSSHCI